MRRIIEHGLKATRERKFLNIACICIRLLPSRSAMLFLMNHFSPLGDKYTISDDQTT